MTDIRERLRAALRDALKARDKVAAAALRSTLADIDNAEAVDVGQSASTGATHARVAGTVLGAGAADVPRRVLSAAQVGDVLRAAVAERESAAADYDGAGRPDAADRLRHEVAVLSAFVDGTRT